MEASRPEAGDGIKILHASLYRMGTWSMAKAYQTLGYTTYHGLDEPMSVDWRLVEQAAEATWPSVPNASPRPPFTRDDWDSLWGNRYDAVCDTSAPFTLELFKAYPHAKVVLVQRDFDSWWSSFQKEILDKLFAPFFEVQIFLAWYLVGFRGGHAMRKLVFGFFNATTRTEIEAHGRETYDGFFKQVRATVPPEQLLEYRLGSGWEPLCEFLGKDVPNISFPHLNERKVHSEGISLEKGDILFAMSKKAMLGTMGVGISVAAIWWLLGN
ncbi:hypothetical protein PFICI_07721 [Pestalotiopsis fici W106-1]|uniref:Efflux pump antibiotic resistance protein n=1 Tax=Pestalotiopsis fici (strain W106-1 / CGMCC3.15140) TaxID=1229662 RepID=W3X474_PESFW|nr:uncharacterized protein PFICI_07721 [Pestalotiopsis fici W106-1]ETS80192.1 hypothetical protein PFICI_07721 [Pestalotiopsis fici W106-1]